MMTEMSAPSASCAQRFPAPSNAEGAVDAPLPGTRHWSSGFGVPLVPSADAEYAYAPPTQRPVGFPEVSGPPSPRETPPSFAVADPASPVGPGELLLQPAHTAVTARYD